MKDLKDKGQFKIEENILKNIEKLINKNLVEKKLIKPIYLS